MIYVEDIQKENLEAGEKAGSADAGSIEKGSVADVTAVPQAS